MSSETDSDIQLARDCLREFEAAPYSPQAVGIVSCLFNLTTDNQMIICRNHAATCLRVIRREIENVLTNEGGSSEDRIEHWFDILNTLKKETGYNLSDEWDHYQKRLEAALVNSLDRNYDIRALAEIKGVSELTAYRERKKYSSQNWQRILTNRFVRRKSQEIERRDAQLFCPVPPVIEAVARVTKRSIGTVQKEWPHLTPDQRSKYITNPEVKAMLDEMKASRKENINFDDLLESD